MAIKQMFGILATRSVELPYENKQEEAEAQKASDTLAEFGLRTGRFVTDWGMYLYNGMASVLKREDPTAKHLPVEDVQKLQSGDLVKIFKTITDGDVHWQGTIKLEYEREVHKAEETGYEQQAVQGFWVHGLQEDMIPVEWSMMFHEALPAKLERQDGSVIYGALDAFFETGTEGVVWSVYEYGKTGYDGLNCLQDGDKLTVYNFVRDGEVEWEGELAFGAESPTKQGWREVLREALHMDTEEWLQLSCQHRPIVVTRGLQVN